MLAMSRHTRQMVRKRFHHSCTIETYSWRNVSRTGNIKVGTGQRLNVFCHGLRIAGAGIVNNERFALLAIG